MPVPNQAGWIDFFPVKGGWNRLTTQFRGDDMCLDIFNGGAQNNQPHLTKCANYTGQFWKVTKTNKMTP